MGTDADPGDTMRTRADENRAKLWLLLGADRWVVAALFLAGVFVSLVVFGALDPAPLRAAVDASDPVETLFQGLLTAIVTGVTLVVSVNQLVLSQELGSLGDQRERMEGAMSFREDAESVLDVPTGPPEPSAFLVALVDAVHDRAAALESATDGIGDDASHRVNEYAADLARHASSVADRLEGTQFGTFELLFVALDFNYSWKISEGRRLRAAADADLPAEADDALDELLRALRLFGPAREHVKTLYFQWELVDLSRAMLVTAAPALVVTTAMILYVNDTATVTGTLLGVDALVWVTSAATVVALTPFAVLVAVVLRVATVAKRTLAIGPFILRRTDRQEVPLEGGDEDGREE